MARHFAALCVWHTLSSFGARSCPLTLRPTVQQMPRPTLLQRRNGGDGGRPVRKRGAFAQEVALGAGPRVRRLLYFAGSRAA